MVNAYNMAVKEAIYIVTAVALLSLTHLNLAVSSDDLDAGDYFPFDDIQFFSEEDLIGRHEFYIDEGRYGRAYSSFDTPFSKGNTATIEQIGNENKARIKQIGGDNEASIEQRGNLNDATSRQFGFANTVEQTQLGNFNWLTATQFGHHNTIVQIQLGDGFKSRIIQVGGYKSIRIVQGY